MPLTIGTRIGQYQVTAWLGAGGMGEVYLARDTRLGRDVALKVLPELLADGDRLARFTREAQILASINHPHIAAIFGVEDTASSPGATQRSAPALVLEFVEGPTLADRIAQGALNVHEALAIARQIAEALEAAHGQGIIHRDLKPANIKVRPDGTVKVLDFGLAKALEPPAVAGEAALTPTITSPAMTRHGVILGTAAYMSPEQARGTAVDSRSDIWAFGCVLYEMLTGTRAFDGDAVSDSLAAVLRSEPAWAALPGALPPGVARVLKRCLEKDARRRFRDIADVRMLLDDASPLAGEESARSAPVRRRAATLVAVAVACLALGAGAAYVLIRLNTAAVPGPVERFEVVTPPGASFSIDPLGTNIAISPDGSQIVYDVSAASTWQLALRRFDRLEQTLIPGTQRASQPIFSPAGGDIAFSIVGQRKLMRVALSGGWPSEICPLAGTYGGGSWGDDDRIVYAVQGSGVFRVPASGGMPEKIATPDPKKGERDYFSPEVLPGGAAMLFTIVPIDGTTNQARIAVRSFSTGDITTLVEGGTQPHYVPTGHLLFNRAGVLMAVPFDRTTLKTAGTPVALLQGVQTKVSVLEGGAANYSVAADGSLLYAAGGGAAESRRLIWMSRSGKPEPIFEQALQYPRYPRLSPLGDRLAVTLGSGNEGQIWIYDLSGSRQPILLTHKGHNTMAVWDPDGKRVVFNSTLMGPRNLFLLPADGSVLDPPRLTTTDNLQTQSTWSRNGDVLFQQTDPKTGADLWVLPMSGPRTPRPWLQTSSDESEPSFSPDGMWVAYVSNQNGQDEVWVRPYPGLGVPIRVSAGVGHDPVWSRTGRELFYQNGTKLMAVDVTVIGTDIRGKPPHELFAGGFVPYLAGTPRSYDVAPNGRFVMIEPNESAPTPTLVVVKNWFEELKRLARN